MVPRDGRAASAARFAASLRRTALSNSATPSASSATSPPAGGSIASAPSTSTLTFGLDTTLAACAHRGGVERLTYAFNSAAVTSASPSPRHVPVRDSQPAGSGSVSLSGTLRTLNLARPDWHRSTYFSAAASAPATPPSCVITSSMRRIAAAWSPSRRRSSTRWDSNPRISSLGSEAFGSVRTGLMGLNPRKSPLASDSVSPAGSIALATTAASHRQSEVALKKL